VKFLLDADSLSYYFRGEGHIADHLRSVTPAHVAIPAPVLYESRHGMLRLASGARQAALLATLDVIPFDAAAAEAAARIRTDLKIVGTAIGPIDIQIAGIALAHAATLVTRNLREFSRVNRLLVANWYDARFQ
jgi:tRNA(fMet)-specific endonuclease VapC